MSPSDRIEALEAEVAYLRSELTRLLTADLHRTIRTELYLGPTEAALLLALWDAKGRTVGFDQLFALLPLSNWSGDLLPIRVYICKLRAKIGAEAIHTTKGEGYALTSKGCEVVNSAIRP